MLKVISLLKRKEGMSREEFYNWATKEHPKLATQLLNIRGYRANAARLDEPEAAFDAVSEMWFDDAAAFDAAFGTEHGKKIQGRVQVEAPRDQVWDMLFDAPTLKQIVGKVPGITVERLEQVSENEYEGTVWVSVAMVKGKYDGKITVLERRPCEYVKFQAQGMGGGNRASGQVMLTLADELQQTVLNYDAQGNLSGPLANFGQRLVDSIGKQFIDQGARALAEQLAAQRHDVITTPSAVTAAPSQATHTNPIWIVAGAAALVLLAILILFWGLRP